MKHPRPPGSSVSAQTDPEMLPDAPAGSDDDTCAAGRETGFAFQCHWYDRSINLMPTLPSVLGGNDQQLTPNRIAEGNAPSVIPEGEPIEENAFGVVAIGFSPRFAAIGRPVDAGGQPRTQHEGAIGIKRLHITKIQFICAGMPDQPSLPGCSAIDGAQNSAA